MKIKSDMWQVATRGDMWRVTCDTLRAASSAPRHVSPVTRHPPNAFTLIELLVVISIMGILAALAVPALKNLGKSNIQVSASRQLLDDIGRARQLAISQHATVYMVFITTNFWLPPFTSSTTWTNGLTPAEFATVVNLCDKQLTGYNFISPGRVGDQPGQHKWHYLDDWKSLPDGTFIAAAKFPPQFNTSPMQIPQWQTDYSGQLDNWLNPWMQIYGFNRVLIPFPTEQSIATNVLPCIIFDHTGKLISETTGNGSYHHAYIPLAQGTVSFGRDANKQSQPTVVNPNDITETPPGNSSSISYNVIDIDPLSGRAKLLVHKIP